jgi:hypothetical protein
LDQSQRQAFLMRQRTRIEHAFGRHAKLYEILAMDRQRPCCKGGVPGEKIANRRFPVFPIFGLPNECSARENINVEGGRGKGAAATTLAAQS